MTALTTAQCQFCGKRVSVLDRNKGPVLHRHHCVVRTRDDGMGIEGRMSRGAIKAGSTQYRDAVTR